ncbi:hypothetical protein P0F65_04130 [Sphingomonas sp. I4]
MTGADVTERHRRDAEAYGKLAAIDRSQAVVEFDLQGYVLAANDMFLSLMGHSRRVTIGVHHRLFCLDDYVRLARLCAAMVGSGGGAVHFRTVRAAAGGRFVDLAARDLHADPGRRRRALQGGEIRP